MLIRGPHLSSTMSDYLVQRIHASKSITLHTCSEVVSLEGANHLSHVTWQSVVTGEKTRFEAEHLFVMIGGRPMYDLAEGLCGPRCEWFRANIFRI